MAKGTPADAPLHRKAERLAVAELRKRYRAEYWALCKEYFDQLKAEGHTPAGPKVHRCDEHRQRFTCCGLPVAKSAVAVAKDDITCRRCNPHASPDA